MSTLLAGTPTASDDALKGSLLALQSCQRALNEYMADAANAGSVPTVKAIADLLGYVGDAVSDCNFEIRKREEEDDAIENARANRIDRRDEDRHEAGLRCPHATGRI